MKFNVITTFVICNT